MMWTITEVTGSNITLVICGNRFFRFKFLKYPSKEFGGARGNFMT